jgi:hypothetical protein
MAKSNGYCRWFEVVSKIDYWLMVILNFIFGNVMKHSTHF